MVVVTTSMAAPHSRSRRARKAAGYVAGAIACYERALELDPHGPNSAAARKCWRSRIRRALRR